MTGHRVDFGNPAIGFGQNVVFVFGAGGQPRNENLPHPARAHCPHRVPDAVPMIEVSGHSNREGIWGPDGKAGSGAAAEAAIDGSNLRTKCLPEFFVATFGNQVQVDFAYGRQVVIRVVGKPLGYLAVFQIVSHDSVVGHLLGFHESLKQAVIEML